MKKIITILLTLAMLLSLASSAVFANDTEDGTTTENAAVPFQTITFDFEDKVEVVTDNGIEMSGPFCGHGNHQTRIVHTSHGDYICSTTGEHRPGKYLKNGFSDGVYEVSVVRVDPETQKTTVVLQHTVAYQTSQISVIADKDENIWAAVIIEETIRNQFDAHKNGTRIELFRIDAVTNEVEFYDMIVSGHDINRGGVGYSSFYYDESIDCIVAFSTDAVAGDVSYLYWHIFDCQTRRFDAETRTMSVYGGRNSYPFFTPDGNGGLVIVTNRNPKITSQVTYTPEMGTNDGIPADVMRKYFPNGRETQEYCFDQINAYVIPDIRSEDNIRHFIVYDTDRSRIKGTLEERLTPEFRMTNEYPIIANNNGGDTYLTDDGLLHVTLKVSYALEAWDHSITEARWVHVVYDVETGEKLSESLIWDEIADGRDYEARIYADPFTKEIYIFSTIMNVFVVKKAVGSPTEGYTYEVVAESQPLASYDRFMQTRWIDCINLAHHRSNSTLDGTLSITGRAPWGYDLFRVHLTYNVGTEENPIALTDLSSIKSLEALPGTTYYTAEGAEKGATITITGDEGTSVSLNGKAVEAAAGKYILTLAEGETNTIVITNSGTEQITCGASYEIVTEPDTSESEDITTDPDESDKTGDKEDPEKSPIGLIIAVCAAVIVIAAAAVIIITKKKKH